MTYYKVLYEDGTAFHGGKGSWFLPKGSRPGRWMPKIEHLKPCRSGYHVCEPRDLLEWIGPAIFEVEVRGKTIRAENKTVVQQARLIRRCNGWNDRTTRLFAIDCAQRALNREKRAGRTPDKRSYEALRVARLYANGKATADDLAAAARDAARAAAAWDAAGAAARDAAGAAAWDAAWDAARDAERHWQRKRLMEYVAGKRS